MKNWPLFYYIFRLSIFRAFKFYDCLTTFWKRIFRAEIFPCNRTTEKKVEILQTHFILRRHTLNLMLYANWKKENRKKKKKKKNRIYYQLHEQGNWIPLAPIKFGWPYFESENEKNKGLKEKRCLHHIGKSSMQIICHRQILKIIEHYWSYFVNDIMKIKLRLSLSRYVGQFHFTLNCSFFQLECL